MKKLLFIIISFSMITTEDDRSICISCDYIDSGYYQLIYAADIANLEGRRDDAFNYINQAIVSCDLINQPLYYEMALYIELLMERGLYDKALFYMEKLVGEYGYATHQIEKFDYFEKMKSAIDWQAKKGYLDSLNIDFYCKIDNALVEELSEMQKKDQSVRKTYNYKDSVEYKEIIRVDSLNERKMKQIFSKYGYPNEKVLGQNKNIVTHSIPTMLMHFEDTVFFKQFLLDEIRKGNCQPAVLGSFVDSNARQKKVKDRFIYWTYDNVPEDQIYDFPNVNKRRLKIGMPTKEMKIKRDSLINIKYGF